MEYWESIYEDLIIIPIIIQGMLIINEFYILKHNILNVEDLTFNIVLLMYLSNIWDDDFDYQWTLVEVNHYYETFFYKAKKNQQDPKQERYKSVSHGYSTYGGEKSQENGVRVY